jgi:signal transduction histidine kinase
VDPAVLVLLTVLGVAAAVAAVAAAATAWRNRSRAQQSLSAIDFVRSTFAGRLRKREPLDELLLQLAEALCDTFRLDAAEVWMAGGGVLERRVCNPSREARRIPLTPAEETVVTNARVSGNAWARSWLPALLPEDPEVAIRVAPLTHQGALLGLIVVERRRQAGSLAAETDETLEELAREVGVALQNARLDSALEATLEQLRQHAAELQASRARIVEAADAERRRIERDLHDGAQQHLVALAVKAGLARELLSRDPARAQAMLGDFTADVHRAIEELRSLAHGIYPPLLSSDGLAEALRAACRRSAIPAQVEAEGLRRYPPALEAAIYFSCIEALQNAAKHAGEGAAACVHLREEDGTLAFEVVDDGAGFDPSPAPEGAGLTNIRDRLGAIGGSVRLESHPGRGTRLSGAVPLEPAERRP